MFLVPAHPGCLRQGPESHKMVVLVVVVCKAKPCPNIVTFCVNSASFCFLKLVEFFNKGALDIAEAVSTDHMPLFAHLIISTILPSSKFIIVFFLSRNVMHKSANFGGNADAVKYRATIIVVPHPYSYIIHISYFSHACPLDVFFLIIMCYF